MPFKQDVIALVDERGGVRARDQRRQHHRERRRRLTASNTDYIAVQRLHRRARPRSRATAVLIRGSGGMASAVAAAFRDAASATGRSSPATRTAGPALAERLGYDWCDRDVGARRAPVHRQRDPDRDERRAEEHDRCPSTTTRSPRREVVFDVVALPVRDAAGPRRPCAGQAGDHRRGGDRPAGRASSSSATPACGRCRAGRGRFGVLPRLGGVVVVAEEAFGVVEVVGATANHGQLWRWDPLGVAVGELSGGPVAGFDELVVGVAG